MKIGKRRPDPEPARVRKPDASTAPSPSPQPVPDSWTAPAAQDPAPDESGEAEPDVVVDGEAVELPPEAVPSPPPVAPAPVVAMPAAVAEEPVAVVSPAGRPVGVTSLGDSAEAYASGHAPPPAEPLVPSWQEPLNELVAERPEVVVGAAFVGGLLAAMILRRLGN